MTDSRSRPQDEIIIRILILDDRGLESQHISDMVNGIVVNFESISERVHLPVEKPEPEITNDPSEIYKIIGDDEDLPDLVFCDLNLSRRGEGEKVAQKIASQHYPTDVLLYSYGAFIDQKINIQSRYGVVLAANEQKIGGYSEWLAWRTIVKLSDPEYIRGLILSRAADTELIIDECLTELFSINDKLRYHFKQGVLRNEGNGPLQKYQVLREAMEHLGMIEKIDSGKDVTFGRLRYIIEKRNLVAHGNTETDYRGGLNVQNRLSISNKKGGSSTPPFIYHFTRDKIKKYLHECFKEDKDLSEMLAKIRETEKIP